MLLALALGLYVARWQWPLPDAVHDVVIGTGAALLVVCAEHFVPLTLFLASPFVLWLGRVSYSLYLSHVPILFALIYGLRDLLPVWLILGLALIVALAAAEVLQRTIEAPAMWLGRQWATSPRASLPHQSQRLTVMPL
jgi:peptidoglycan/LPS O-acetylase OafA/YrhL